MSMISCIDGEKNVNKHIIRYGNIYEKNIQCKQENILMFGQALRYDLQEDYIHP